MVNDIGEPAKVLLRDEALNILRSIGKNQFPIFLTDFFKDNYNYSLKAIKLVPDTYFILNNQLQNNHKIIYTTINSFKRHKRLKELNTKTIPLKYKRNRKYDRK